jgi:hypothetical protein
MEGIDTDIAGVSLDMKNQSRVKPARESRELPKRARTGRHWRRMTVDTLILGKNKK